MLFEVSNDGEDIYPLLQKSLTQSMGPTKFADPLAYGALFILIFDEWNAYEVRAI